jgi:hypothetical protein
MARTKVSDRSTLQLIPTNKAARVRLKAKLDDFDTTLDFLIGTAPATRSGAGAISLTNHLTLFTSTGAGNALTLANGTYAGQRVRVIHSVKGSSGTGVITPTTFDHTSVTLTNAYASVEFVWTGTTWTIARLIDATVTG